jgi:nitrite reductase (NO-forming)
LGVPKAFPPLAGSDFLLADKRRAIGVVVNGLEGPVKVNGETFNSVMPKLALSDDDVASVVTYILNSWGNKGDVIQSADVVGAKGGH